MKNIQLKTFLPFIHENKIGFRLSLIDCLVIILAFFITFFLSQLSSLSLLDHNSHLVFHYFILFVVGNFFLFCNVFRIRTKLELIWIIFSFLNLIVFIFIFNHLGCFLLGQLLLSMAVIGYEMTTEHYHGVFAYKINQNIDKYLQKATLNQKKKV